MPRFAYSARDAAGTPVSAELEAPGRKDVLRILAARGLRVSSVTELTGPAGRQVRLDERVAVVTPLAPEGE